jgi:signal transduction histidine kinase
VQNTNTHQVTNCLLGVGRQGRIELFNAKGQLLQRTGTYFMPYNVREWQPIRLRVPPGQTRAFYVKVTNLVRVVDPIVAVLHTPASLKQWFADNSDVTRWLFLGLAMVVASLLIMSLFAISQFAFNRDTVFLYYALFCFVVSFYVLWNMNFRLGLGLPLQMHATSRSFTFVLAFFYALFIGRFIDISTHFPKTWRVLQVFLVVFVVQEALTTYEYFYGLLFRSNWPYLRQELTFLLAGLMLFITLLRSKSPVRRYLMLGMGSLWGVAYFHTFLDIRVQGGDPSLLIFINYTPFFFGLGAVIENFFFLLALAYRNRLVEVEKNQMQARYTQELEVELAQRVNEIRTQNKRLEAQRIQQLETEFEQKLADSEMTALRAQMNPHFIFNCLNSIKLYTLQNDTDRASDYLSRFARLIRLVLENSRAERVTLHNELEALRLYSDLEAMRFKHKVTIHIHIAPDIDPRFVTIPPLLIQPYVENAIWHGLMHKPEGGTVTVEVETQDFTSLQINITDDGIGRERAAALKSKSASGHKSFGMQATADRIRMINELYKVKNQARIRDLVSPDGEPIGTKVLLTIPL